MSLYLSPKGILTFSVNAQKEQYSVRTQIGSGGVPFGKFFYLVCEIGIDGQSTLMRMVVDNNEIEPIRFPLKIDLRGLIAPSMVIGSDLNCKNGAFFDFISLDIFLKTLTTSDITTMQKLYYKWLDDPQIKYLTINHQCVRVNQSKINLNNKLLTNNGLFLVIDPNFGIKINKEGKITKLFDASGNNNDFTITNN